MTKFNTTQHLLSPSERLSRAGFGEAGKRSVMGDSLYAVAERERGMCA